MRWALGSGLLVLALGIGPAFAQDSASARQLARDHFNRGMAAFERGDYGEATGAFRSAYELTQHPDLLYNIYSAQERNGELAEAAEALEGYLRDGEPEALRREALELRLERLRLRLEQEQVQATERETQARREREVAAEQLERERRGREELERVAAAERLARTESARASADAVTWTGALTFAVGGLGLAGFGVLGGLSVAEDGSLASSCGRDAGRVCREADTSTLGALNTGADVSLIAGASLAVVGVALLLVGESLRPGDDETATLAPVLGPDQIGVVLGGRF